MFYLLLLPKNQSSTENHRVKGKNNYARGLVKSEKRTCAHALDLTSLSHNQSGLFF